MNVLALDPGISVGWAQSDGTTGTLDLSRWVKASSPECDHGAACHLFDVWLRTATRPGGTLATERAVFGRGNSLGGFVQGLLHISYMQAHRADLRRKEASAGEWRKWLLGYGRAPKVEGEGPAARTRKLDAAIRAAVEARGFRPANEHEADAAGLLCFIEKRPSA